jgi:hypothetical protein
MVRSLYCFTVVALYYVLGSNDVCYKFVHVRSYALYPQVHNVP